MLQCRVLSGFPAADSGGAGEPSAPPSEPPALGSEPAAPAAPENMTSFQQPERRQNPRLPPPKNRGGLCVIQ